MHMNPTPPGDPLVWRDPELGPWLLGYDHIKDVSPFSYLVVEIADILQVDAHWPKQYVAERSHI